jgi:hypothetical protein
MRHTFATRLVQRGVERYKVQRLLGYKTISMTQRYAHHSSKSFREGVKVLDECPPERFSRNLAHGCYGRFWRHLISTLLIYRGKSAGIRTQDPRLKRAIQASQNIKRINSLSRFRKIYGSPFQQRHFKHLHNLSISVLISAASLVGIAF